MDTVDRDSVREEQLAHVLGEIGRLEAAQAAAGPAPGRRAQPPRPAGRLASGGPCSHSTEYSIAPGSPAWSVHSHRAHNHRDSATPTMPSAVPAVEPNVFRSSSVSGPPSQSSARNRASCAGIADARAFRLTGPGPGTGRACTRPGTVP